MPHFEPTERWRFLCRGRVQGVGFRPTVARWAGELGLAGSVLNDGQGVTIEAEGPVPALRQLQDRLLQRLPPLASLVECRVTTIAATGGTGFAIGTSAAGPASGARLPADTALCADCRRELDTPGDPRFHHPFITCTACGPRYTVCDELPWDRARTTMACFPLCDDCRQGYEDPCDRRFHAEPTSCPDCGPRLRLMTADGRELAAGPAALDEARQRLANGEILAIKGMGGFQLACRADKDGPVARLRTRKNRPAKPLAVMAREETLAGLLRLDAAATSALLSPRAPIVIAAPAPGAALSGLIAPHLGEIGAMRPTTAMHLELLRAPCPPVLVTTSGNRGGEPLCRGNREALDKLAGIADAFLIHDRDVRRPLDDSVLRAAADGPFLIRRARGFVPDGEPLPSSLDRAAMAMGGQQQACGCLALGREAVPAAHAGDLDSLEARAFLRESLLGLESLLGWRAEDIVVDRHPDYASRRLGEVIAAERGAALHEVQHHAAHAAAVIAEHGLVPSDEDPIGALILDGTGLGLDGQPWGGEWLLVAGGFRWRREARLEPLPLVGGEAAVREPWRVLAAALARTGLARPAPDGVSPRAWDFVAGSSGGPWPAASGAGRFFEAAGALLAGCPFNRWEGEAACRLEALALRDPRLRDADGSSLGKGLLELVWRDPPAIGRSAGLLQVQTSALLARAAIGLEAGRRIEGIAAGLHATFCVLAAEVARRLWEHRCETVVLGGGCLANRLLRAGLTSALAEHGLRARLPRRLPAGDGGLAYGQCAALALERGRPAVAVGQEDVEDGRCVLPSR